jgi:ABC-type uncharacterized transport system permease subunit
MIRHTTRHAKPIQRPMLRLEVRPQPSRWWSYASPLLALAITLVIGVVLFMALGKDPVRGLQMFFWEPIKSPYAWGELMVKATPLLIIALGLAVCFRSNVWNIGAEGQFVMGAIFAAGVALTAGPSRAPGWWWPCCWRVCWAACSGPALPPCCATASTPTKSWSA